MSTPCFCAPKDLFNFGCRCKGQKKLFVWSSDDREWWIAEDAEEVAALCHKQCGVGPGEGGAPEDWTLVPDNKIITVWDESGASVNKKTARQWADEEPKGFLCGGDF